MNSRSADSSIHASKTSCGAAARIRSTSADGSWRSALWAASVEVRGERVGACLPRRGLLGDPGPGVTQSVCPHRQPVLTAADVALDEPRRFEHHDVLRHGRQGNRERDREVGDPRVAGPECDEKPAARRICQSAYTRSDPAGSSAQAPFHSLSALLVRYFSPHPSASWALLSDSASSSLMSSRRRRLFSNQGR